MTETESKSVFISSCSRRDLARRRGMHSFLRVSFVIALAVAVVALGVFLVVHGGF
jgi:hypothetical protein